MKVLIACEYSGIVRDAFIKAGHDAISCDIEPTDSPGPHIQDNVLNHLNEGWDLMIAHPPCTYLTSAGWWYYKDFPDLVNEAFEFFMKLINADIPKICIENPTSGIINKRFRKPNQIIEPYYFGDKHRKRTALWLKRLPRLNGDLSIAKNINQHIPDPIYTDKSGKKRYFVDATPGLGNGGKLRSKFWRGIANAMARQWGNSPIHQFTNSPNK